MDWLKLREDLEEEELLATEREDSEERDVALTNVLNAVRTYMAIVKYEQELESFRERFC